MPFQGPKPDLPGTPEGVRDAYFAYPRSLVKSVTRPIGQGDDITLFSNVPQAPLPLDQNPVWQKVNNDLNINWKLNLAATSADAAQKLGAMVAGNDLPDNRYVGRGSGVRERTGLFEALTGQVLVERILQLEWARRAPKLPAPR